ncbi:O-antigen ligase family protein [Patescibacteria group bacterium]|nr:O-antigen ligase family protein [Patescibacteria group bacterium]
MTNQRSQIYTLLIAAFVIGVPLLYYLTKNPSWQNIIQVIILVLLVPFFLVDFEYGFLALVILRPAMDIFSELELVKAFNYSFNLSSIVSLLTIVWALFYFLNHRKTVWRRPLFYPILIFFGLSFASVFYTASVSPTLTEIVRISSMFIIYLLASEIIVTKLRFKRWLTALGISLIIPVVVAIIQFITASGLSFADVNNRLYGTFGHPNALAFYLVLTIGIFLTYYFNQRPIKPNKTFLLGIGLLLLILLLTYTRGAWIGLAIYLILTGLFWYRKLLLIISGIIVVIMLIFPTVNQFTFNEYNFDLYQIPIVERLTDDSEESSVDWRIKVWTEMSRKIEDRPYFGYGLGTFPFLREQMIKGFFISTEAHNDYLRLTIEVGIIGLLIYLIILLKNIFNLIKSYINSTYQHNKIWFLGAIGLALAFMFMSFFDNILQGTAVMWAFWAFMAAINNLHKFNKE